MASEPERVLELVVFKLGDGVTREQFLGTVDGVSRWISRRPGFISRELSYDGDGDRWIEVVWWKSMAEAQGAAELAMSSDSCAPMFADRHGVDADDPRRARDPSGRSGRRGGRRVSRVLEPEEILTGLLRERPAGDDLLRDQGSRRAERQGLEAFTSRRVPVRVRDERRDVRAALRPAAPAAVEGQTARAAGHDVTQLGVLTPHPVYAWMRWVQILAPSPDRFESLRPLLAESLDLVHEKWKRRSA